MEEPLLHFLSISLAPSSCTKCSVKRQGLTMLPSLISNFWPQVILPPWPPNLWITDVSHCTQPREYRRLGNLCRKELYLAHGSGGWEVQKNSASNCRQSSRGTRHHMASMHTRQREKWGQTYPFIRSSLLLAEPHFEPERPTKLDDSQSAVCGPAAVATLRNSKEMQVLWPLPSALNQNLHFNKIPRVETQVPGCEEVQDTQRGHV
ncbi:uncharacterized protein LOC114672761 [Macaca mulatta]